MGIVSLVLTPTKTGMGCMDIVALGAPLGTCLEKNMFTNMLFHT